MCRTVAARLTAMGLIMNNDAPSPMQVANDLRAQAKALEGRHVSGWMMDGVCRSMIRGADTIEHLLKIKCDLEAAAEAEAQKYEDYVYGRR